MSEHEQSNVATWKREIGQQIQIERKAQKITQKQAAKLLGLSVKTVSFIERGNTPTMGLYILYCDMLGVDFASITMRARMVIRSRDAEFENELERLL